MNDKVSNSPKLIIKCHHQGRFPKQSSEITSKNGISQKSQADPRLDDGLVKMINYGVAGGLKNSRHHYYPHFPTVHASSMLVRTLVTL